MTWRAIFVDEVARMTEKGLDELIAVSGHLALRHFYRSNPGYALLHSVFACACQRVRRTIQLVIDRTELVAQQRGHVRHGLERRDDRNIDEAPPAIFSDCLRD